MTREKAIKHFESYIGNECYTDYHQEACRMAISALRAQQTKLDRNKWKGCDCCKGDLDGYTAQFRDAGGRSRPLYIPEGEAMIVASGKYNHQFCIPVGYCPHCGRPLTEKSWEELEKQVHDLTQSPNDPLTLEELREMDGEPVFCVSKAVPENSAWGIICMRENVPYVRTTQNKGKVSILLFGKLWCCVARLPPQTGE